ncbi:MAG TPA: gamma-glutamylcyclotransferase [Parvularculaceae bacterium]|nr:gamma-glutamylcyclotransferase [Parvularculaceae bacterium]
MQQSNEALIFFYGTFMNADVLEKHGLGSKNTAPAKLLDYELTIRPRVNLRKRENKVVYGATTSLAHDDVSSLYDGLQKNFGLVYRPYAVLAHYTNHSFAPALCYVADSMEDGEPDEGYIRQMAECAELAGAPNEYIDHIRSFLGRARR